MAQSTLIAILIILVSSFAIAVLQGQKSGRTLRNIFIVLAMWALVILLFFIWVAATMSQYGH